MKKKGVFTFINNRGFNIYIFILIMAFKYALNYICFSKNDQNGEKAS